MSGLKSDLRNIKLFIIISILILVFVFMFGMFLLKDNPYFTQKYVGTKIDYYKEVIDYSRFNNRTVLEGIKSALFGEKEGGKNYEEQKYAKSVPILLYHGLIDKPDGQNALLEDFKDQMFTLKQAGWETISVKDFYDFMKEGKKLPERSFLLTFDDSRKDSYYPADGILRALNYTAVMFVITGHSLGNESKGSVFYLSRAELKQMQKTGRWEMQPHTKDGHDLYVIDNNGTKGKFFPNLLWLKEKNRRETYDEFRKRITEDFVLAKKDIGEELKTTSYGFAFPFGDYGQNNEDENISRIVLDSGKSVYSFLAYQVNPSMGVTQNYPDKNEFMIKRIRTNPAWNGKDVLRILESTNDKELPYKNNFSENIGIKRVEGEFFYTLDGWRKTWGEYYLDDDKLVIKSVVPGTGSAMFLDGTYAWRDYEYRAKIEQLVGSSVGLMARYHDPWTHVSCQFGRNALWIEQLIDKNSTVLFDLEKEFILPERDFEVGIRVFDNNIECLFEGKVVAGAYDVSGLISQGGVGVDSWDNVENNSTVVIDEIAIYPIEKKEDDLGGRGDVAYGLEDVNIKSLRNVTTVSFSIMDERGNFVNIPGVFGLKIKDGKDFILFEKKIALDSGDYEVAFSEKWDKKSYRYSFNFSTSILTGSSTDQIYSRFSFLPEGEEKEVSAILKKELYDIELDSEKRYLLNSVEVNRTIRQGDFEFTILRVGTYVPYERLQDNVSLIDGRDPNYGASKYVRYYRIDFKISNLAEKSQRLTFYYAYLKDPVTNKIYEIRYENDVRMLDGTYQTYSSKEDFVLFRLPELGVKSVDFNYKNKDENYDLRFNFKGLPVKN